MVIWQGLGFLAIVLPMIGYILVSVTVGAIEGPGYTAQHSWPGALGTLIGACVVWLLALRLDQPGRQLVDPKTGQVVVLRKKHTLFFVPMKYVALFMAGVALWIFFVQHGSSI
jgi:hypothetical protein